MAPHDNDTATKSGAVPEPPSRGDEKEIQSPPVPPGTQLDARERKVWDYICRMLTNAGMPHLTAGIAIAVVCRTFIRWVDTEIRLSELEKTTGTYYVTTPNGFVQPHQYFFAAAKLKEDLRKWLPESCLTLPSTVTARAKLGDEGQQDDLFGELVAHARVERKSTSTH